MRYALCLVDTEEHGISDEVRRGYEILPRARALRFEWLILDNAAVLTAWDDPWGDPLVAQDGHWLAVGLARLDNRPQVERLAGIERPGLTDLELVLRLVARTGSTQVRELLGDFAFVVYHAATHTALAATDAMGVRKLFYREQHGLMAFATRAEALALDGRYEPQFLAESIALCPITPGLTAFAGLRRLAAGNIATLKGGEVRLRAYWCPEEFEAAPFTTTLEREAPRILRHLLATSVKQRMSGNGDTWAQLSGGLDSSSIVSMSQWLTEQREIEDGLAGTVTFVDWQGTDADEREYSDAVTARWGIRNETIVDAPLWVDDQVAFPLLDQPKDSFAFYPRERRLCAIVRGAGGRVLLAGFGSDELFTGTTLFFADWLIRGNLWRTIRELARWGARGRVSFWEIAWGNALVPLFPAVLRRPVSFTSGRLIPWITEDAERRYSLRERTHAIAENSGRRGHKYRDTMLRRVGVIRTQLDAGIVGDALDVRYPFLARPLVEFALGLPPQLCARPHERKWVLREAMRGLLPETVRTRVGKGGPTDLLVRSLDAQRSLLQPMLEEPILAELGVVDAASLRAAFEAAPRGPAGDRNLSSDVQNTLMVEAWLRLRSGRWPPGPPSQ